VSLTDFLSTGTNGGPDTSTVVMPSASWADEMDEDDRDSRGGTVEKFVLPTAPRAARGPDMSDERIPRDPPYTAYIANLSYDVDTEVVMNFFGKLRIKGVRLPRDGDAETGRLKGFGYADFEDRESLVEALNMNDHLLQNRKIRVDLATHAGRGNERSGFGDRGGGRYNNRDNDDDDRTAGDWRSGPPPPPRDNDRDRGYDRGGDRRGGDRDGSRGFDRYEPPRERGGYDRDDRRDDRRDGNRGYGFSRDDRDRGYGGDRDRGYGGDRDRGYGGDRYNRDDRRDRGGFDRYDRRDDRRRSPEPPKERPRLKLQPRQTEKAEGGDEHESSTKSSIFGSAKPVDTAKKEAEIDQKLQETQSKVRTIDLASKRRDEEERQKAERRDSEKDNDNESKPKGASIFGAAKPVDTSSREKEIDERLKKQNDSKSTRNVDRRSKDDDRDAISPNGRTQSQSSNRSCDDEDKKPDIKKPASSDIFGSAKPIDTSAREREIEEKLKKSRAANAENQKPGRRDDRGEQSYKNRPNRGGGGDRNYDRRDDGRDRRRDDRRDGDRHHDRNRDNRQDGRRQGHDDNRRNKSPPPMKKVDEQKAPNFIGSNKFQFLQGDDEVGSGKSDSE